MTFLYIYKSARLKSSRYHGRIKVNAIWYSLIKLTAKRKMSLQNCESYKSSSLYGRLYQHSFSRTFFEKSEIHLEFNIKEERDELNCLRLHLALF